MTGRVLPTEPGWWWAFVDGKVPTVVRVARDKGGPMYACDGPWVVTDPLWTWLEPIPAPGEVAALRADLRRIQDEAVARGWDIDRLRADLELAQAELAALRGGA